MLYTRQVTLEEITPEEYEKRENNFKLSPIQKHWFDIFSRIRDPIVDRNYEKLIFYLLSHDDADELCVNDQGTWVKQYARRITDVEIREMARIASNDSVKRNYLEIKLKRPKLYERLERATIEFIEYNGSIIGYKISVPYELEDLFNIEKCSHANGYRYNQGLWVPKECETEQMLPRTVLKIFRSIA